MMAPQAVANPPPVIAVVDDDPAVCNSLKFSLELEGFKVRTFAGGADILRSREAGVCDCFVIDQRMPGLSGLELIEKLRDQHIAAPAILIISEPSAALAARAAQAHVPIVEKPFLGNALLDCIRQTCRRAE